MDIRTTSSLALVALAATTFSLPLSSPAVAQSSGDMSEPHACAPSPDNELVLRVGANGYKSILQAIFAARQCKHTGDLVIELHEGADDYQLPHEIPAGFNHVHIRGVDPGITVTQPKYEDKPIAVAVVSPLVIENLTVDMAGDLFDPENNLSIIRSSFSGKGTVVKTSKKTNNSLRLTISRSNFTNVGIAHVNQLIHRVELAYNTVSINEGGSEPILELGPLVDLGIGSRIEDNTFTVGTNAFTGPIVKVARPGVSITRNAFVGQSEQVAAIELEVPGVGRTLGDNALPRAIRIHRNMFTELTPFRQNQPVAPRNDQVIQELLASDDVVVDMRYNDVSHTSLTEIRPSGQFLPQKHYVEACNYWGAKGMELATADPDRRVLKEWFTSIGPDDQYEAVCVPAKTLKPQIPDQPAPGRPNPNGNGGVVPGPSTPGNNAGGGTNPSGDTNIAGDDPMKRFGSTTRFETAVAVSMAQYPTGGAKAVILARSDVAADSVSAVPLAKAIDAPVLLTQPDQLHTATEAEIKRLLPNGGKIVLMGGPVAINQSVEDHLVKQGYTIERIAGANRAGTAVTTAEHLTTMGKAKAVLLVDGADWQPDLIAGPAAAQVEGVTLLTNGAAMADETATFLATHAALPVTAIGARAKQAGSVQSSVVADDPSALSIEVATRFFPKAEAVGFATTATFADALAGGAHIAKQGAPLILLPGETPAVVRNWVKANAGIKTFFVYGGTKAISDEQVEALHS
ncbi:cell wall-binding repeat-containing protein [Stomatohabitans albus]|uniref:cell wall-binding repeat-containing protein n=1 Tax=Stomatohabitans albus TaxID=3110766 RepID=UPI00300C12E1